MSNQVKVVRGHINIMILKALEEGDKYGYEIGKYIETKTDGGYIIKQATLYSTLNRLEDRGILLSYWGDETETHGGRRKYFSLTDIGREISKNNIKHWSQHRKFIDAVIKDDDNKTVDKENKKISDVAGDNTAPPKDTKANILTAEGMQESYKNYADRDNKTQNLTAATTQGTTAATSQFLTEKNLQSNNSDNYNRENPNNNQYKSIISKLVSGVFDDDTKNNNDSIKLPTNEKSESQRPHQIFGASTTVHPENKNANLTIGEQLKERQPYLSATEHAYNANAHKVTHDNNASGYFAANSNYERGTRESNRLDFGGGNNADAGGQYNRLGSEAGTSPQRDELLESFRQKTGQALSDAGEAAANYSLLPASSRNSPFERLKTKMNDEGFSVRSYTNVKSPDKQFLLINKQNFMSMAILFLVMALQTLGIYFFVGEIINLPMDYYLYAAGICFIFPFAAAVQYYVYPDKRTKRRYYAREIIISAVMHFLVAVLAISAIALIFDTNVALQSEFILKLIVPCIYASNFIWHSIIWAALYKGKHCFL